VSNRGSIDWLCWPRFDSPSIFGAILDPEVGGCWSIRPAQQARVSRRYVDNTNVLETTFGCDSAKIVLTDFMPVTSEEQKRQMLWPEHELVRYLKCTQGEMDLIVTFDPRIDYGRVRPKITDAGRLGWRIDTGTAVLSLQADTELTFDPEQALSGRFTLRAGDVLAFSLSVAAEAPAVIPPPGDLVAEKLELTLDWWQQWAAKSNYDGPYQRQVVRSALLLKLLSYAPSGAIIAAPTTSLPEVIGRELNWDYRFAWLRDASFTVHALFGLGYKQDAAAFVDWLLHSTRLTRPELRVVYDVFGESPPAEHDLPRMRGYADSRPVRVGNAAMEQLQLDIYGEVVEAVSQFMTDKNLDRDVQTMLRQCGEYVCEHWREPDNGIWEQREQRLHYTHSRLMCWVVLDRLLQMHARGQLKRISMEKYAAEKQQIREDIERHSWNPKVQAYMQACGSETLDASVLLLAYHGFENAGSERMQQTQQRIRERLSPRPGLMHRNEQSKNRHEGTFAVCSFWEADFLARSGRLHDAHETFEAILQYANDLDLFAEEIDPTTGDALGNFPQAFTHLGLINAALSLNNTEK
jgi:GH15 family glucan-1,4-alpha-glucosidase